MGAATQPAGPNLLHQDIDYEWTETPLGVWRRYMYSNGALFAEYVSHAKAGAVPLVHITWGKCPETARRVHAVGVIAIGRRATGVLAIGQMAVGVIAIGQLALGVGLGLGQASTGLVAIGQAVLAAAVGIGQVVYSGYIAVAQVGYGHYVLAQLGWGEHVIDTRGMDQAAKELFLKLVGR
jgi:hypothetical protein